MGRLSRFKKSSVSKFPQPTNKMVESDSDDEDFIGFIKRGGKEVGQTSSAPSSGESSVSEYFSKPNVGKCSSKAQTSQDDKGLSHASNRKALASDQRRIPKQATKTKKTAQQQEVVMVPDEDNDINKDIQLEPESGVRSGKPKTKCPFCFKELADKLTGTTHIKSCAKDLPTDQVIKVMELYERQLQEWKDLGLPCPVFSGSSGNTNTKKPVKPKESTRRRGGAGSSRGKKNDDGGGADPELELALALSISLHEEVESRIKKEDKKAGEALEGGSAKNNIVLDSVTTVQPSSESTKPKPAGTIKVTPVTMPEPRHVIKRRGKKIQLNTLPLFTVNDSQKKQLIEEKVVRVIDEAETPEERMFCVRDEGLVENLGVPRRLKPFQDKECRLWSLASGGKDVPEDSFSVLEFSKRPMPDLSKSVEFLVEPDKDPSDQVDAAEIHDSSYFQPLVKVETDQKVQDIQRSIEPAREKSSQLRPASTPSSKSHKRRQTTSSCDPPQQALKNLPQVVRDIATLLYSRTNCDFTLYGREEKRIKCHKLIVLARCPKLLKDVIVEKRGDSRREVVPLTDFSHACVHAFVWYLYTGRTFFHDVELFSELQDLAKAYGIEVVDSGGLNAFGKPGNEVSTQTEMRLSLTNPVDSADPVPSAKESANDALIDHVNTSKLTQELFTTILEENSLAKAAVSLVQDRPNPDGDMWDSDEDPHSSSRDLFEDLEDEETKPNSKAVELNQNLSVQYSESELVAERCGEQIEDVPNPTVHQSVRELVEIPEESSDEEDGIDIEDIESPSISQQDINTSERKRSRSVSPTCFDSDRPSGLFTATQAAYFLKDGKIPNDCPSLIFKEDSAFQANKKQKLDTIITNSDSGFDTSESELKNADFEIMEVATTNDFAVATDSQLCNNYADAPDTFTSEMTFLKAVSELENRCLVEPKASNSETACTNARTPKTPSNLRKFRSGSTPNLSRNMNNEYSFVSNSQQVPQNVSKAGINAGVDPFELDGDDTFFANVMMPEFSVKIVAPVACAEKVKPVVPVINAIENTPPSRDSLRSGAACRPISRKTLTLDDEIDTDADNLPKQKRGRQKQGTQKGKVKQTAKVTLPSSLKPPTTTAETNTTTSSQPVSKSKPVSTAPCGKGQSSSSPMLNYSLIDTPILKTELKKYGLKPLPRSKAKVLLRHIYHETHK